MSFVALMIVGFVAGMVARLFVPGSDHLGWFGTLLVGVSGSLFGGFLGKLLEGNLQVSATGLFGSVVGAVIVLLAYQAARSRVA